MRVTPLRAALAAALSLNLVLLLRPLAVPSPPCRPPPLPPGVTVIVRELPDVPERDASATLRSFSALPGVRSVLLAAEESPYPPPAAPLPPRVAVLTLRPQPHRTPPRPDTAVRTRHVALVPDGARATPGLLRRMRDVLEASIGDSDGDSDDGGQGGVRVVAAAVGPRPARCLQMDVDVRAWTVRYSYGEQRSDHRNDHWSDHRSDHQSDHRSDHRNDHHNDLHGDPSDHHNNPRGDHQSDSRGHNNLHADHGDHQNDHRNDHQNDHQNDRLNGHQNDQWGDFRAAQWNDHQNDQWNDHQNDQWGDFHAAQQNDQWNDHRNDHRSDPQSDPWTAHPRLCGALDGAPAVLLLRTRDLFSLPFPLSRPVVTSLTIQASIRGWRLLLVPWSFPLTARSPLSPHGQWKTRESQARRHRALMAELGVKLELLPDGGRSWHGCTKDTPRCFGTVHSQTPQYLLSGRWTPPCCLRALRATARHVLAQLEAAGVRHWLEGGSLLGAVRLGDIIPWDYDVDVGLYRDDVPKCHWLAQVAATGRPVEDTEGFWWEKAAEGDFYRVHYSRTNRLHVDLWPFYARPDGVMTKDTWLGHPQDVEFPERLLQPPASVAFAGVTARAPRDPRAFLELKFGVGVVENPEYPNPAVRRLAEDLDNKTHR